MPSIARPLLVAVYTQLDDDPGLAGLGAAVFDEVPEPRPAPYVLLGEVDEIPAEAHDRDGVTATLTLHVWSRYRGYAEAARIADALDTALHRQPLTVVGWQKVSVAAAGRTYMRDPDPQLRHCVARYRVWAEQPPAEDN